MKQKRTHTIDAVVLVIFIVFCWMCMIPNLAAAEQNITLNGVFLSDKKQGDLNTYVLWNREAKWYFKVTKSVVSDSDLKETSGKKLLSEVAPPLLEVIGPEKDIRFLKESKVAGKTFEIKGTLYTGEAIFCIISLEEIKNK